MDPNNVSNEEVQKKLSIRKVRELFRGRFTDKETRKLLDFYEWDISRTIQNILNAEPRDLNELLGNQDVAKRIAAVTENEVYKDLARRNEIEAEIRQYGCEDCDNMWWRRVTTRKPVSRCKTCKRKFDPIPRDKEWGTAEFECICGSSFKGIGAMGESESMCYRCGAMCSPVRILPPFRQQEDTPRIFRNRHSCNAPNCYNRKGNVDPRKICLHPKSRGIRVLHASTLHVSTGSTVNTFLDQSDLDPPYEPSLAAVQEADENDVDTNDVDGVGSAGKVKQAPHLALICKTAQSHRS